MNLMSSFVEGDKDILRQLVVNTSCTTEQLVKLTGRSHWAIWRRLRVFLNDLKLIYSVTYNRNTHNCIYLSRRGWDKAFDLGYTDTHITDLGKKVYSYKDAPHRLKMTDFYIQYRPLIEKWSRIPEYIDNDFVEPDAHFEYSGKLGYLEVENSRRNSRGTIEKLARRYQKLSEAQDGPMRVFFVCNSREMAFNMAKRLAEQAPEVNQMMFFFCSYDEMMANPMGAIWYAPNLKLYTITGEVVH